MGSLVDVLVNLPPHILSTWGYAIVFLISIAESLPFIGLAIPGGVVVIAAGFFAHVGILKLIPTIIIVILGAFIGDSTSYILGRWYGHGIIQRFGKFVLFKPTHFEKAKRVLHTHPGKAIVIGRSQALTRCIMPFAAGSVEVPMYIFFPYAIVAAITWSVFNIFLGIIFGASFRVASRYVGVIFFAAVVISILVLYSYRFISRFTSKNKKFIDRFQLYPVFINLISIYVFAKVTESVISGTRIHIIDQYINSAIAALRTPLLTNILVFMTELATPANLIVVSIVFAIVFIIRHRWYFLSLLPLSLCAGALSEVLIKRVTHVFRPLYPLVPTVDFSFPSGHATLSMIFFGLLVYFFRNSFRTEKARNIYFSLCAAMIGMVSFSRIYLNAHWLSDVIAGLALGTFWLSFFIIVLHFFTSFSKRRAKEEFKAELTKEHLE